ncbi:MAG: DUF222 domain-containing protein [Mycobacteriales bacterium]
MRSHGGVLARLTELIGQLPDDADAETLIGLRKVIQQAEAKSCRQIRSFDARQGYAATDPSAVSTPAWLRYWCRMAPGDASRHVLVARMLPSLPEAEAAFTTGEISFQHAAVICELARQTSVEDARRAEAYLLVLARASHPTELRIAAQRVRYCLNPDGSLRDFEKQYLRRTLHIAETFDGTVAVDATLDPASGAIFRGVIDALTALPAPGDDRTRPQRQADALIELCRLHMDNGSLRTRGRQYPHVNVTVGLETLLAVEGCEPGRLDHTTVPIPAETVQRLACDAEFTRIVLGPESEVLDVGRTRRLAHPPLDRAIRHRDRTCRWETCDRPANMCHLHHVIPWWAGGRTDQDNMIMLCEFHHRLVHEGRQPVRLRSLDTARQVIRHAVMRT